MMNNTIYTDLVSHDKKRMMDYKKFALYFSYPEGKLFKFFPDLSSRKDELISDYDRLFRFNEIWLFGTEYLAENEFQKTGYLADIMGFYHAFGLEPDGDRPDLLSTELEFMHYLIFKQLNISSIKRLDNKTEKIDICLDAQHKFFQSHLYPAAGKIITAILNDKSSIFYTQKAYELSKFIESEVSFYPTLVPD